MSGQSIKERGRDLTVGERLVLIEQQLSEIDKWMGQIDKKLEDRFAEKDDLIPFNDRLLRMEKAYYTMAMIAAGVSFGILATLAFAQNPGILKLLT